MSWGRFLEDVSWKTPDDVLKKKIVATSISDQSRTSLRPKLKRFYDVFATSLCRLGRVMVERSTLQLYRTTIFLAQPWMAASNHLINKCDQNIRQVKNPIKHQIRRKSKQLGFWSFCLVFPNSWSVLYLASCKSRTHYSIALKFSAVQLNERWSKQCLFFF